MCKPNKNKSVSCWSHQLNRAGCRERAQIHLHRQKMPFLSGARDPVREIWFRFFFVIMVLVYSQLGKFEFHGAARPIRQFRGTENSMIVIESSSVVTELSIILQSKVRLISPSFWLWTIALSAVNHRTLSHMCKAK